MDNERTRSHRLGQISLPTRLSKEEASSIYVDLFSFFRRGRRRDKSVSKYSKNGILRLLFRVRI